MLGAYVHIPFCVSKCHYCDFNSIGMGNTPVPEREYLRDLGRDMESWQHLLASAPERAFATVFFGGGTPSLFSPQGIADILHGLQHVAAIRPDAEVTLELNPKTADFEKMKGFLAAGIRRLSIGVQSLEEEILRPLARAHSAAEALQALDWALQVEFPRLNIDLMYALPGQELRHLDHTLDQIALRPISHVSAYELIWEEGTPFYDQWKRGQRAPADEELALRMAGRVEEFCSDRGLQAYEVSNFARAGHESRHNLHYWDYESFIGMGAGAVSFLRWDELSAAGRQSLGMGEATDLYGVRLTRPKPLQEYSSRAGDPDGFEVEWISRATAMQEFMMMGLRKTNGIRFDDFERKFRRSAAEYFAEPLQRAKSRGYLQWDEAGCRFTPTGMKLSNEVLCDFISPSTPY